MRDILYSKYHRRNGFSNCDVYRFADEQRRTCGRIFIVRHLLFYGVCDGHELGADEHCIANRDGAADERQPYYDADLYRDAVVVFRILSVPIAPLPFVEHEKHSMQAVGVDPRKPLAHVDFNGCEFCVLFWNYIYLVLVTEWSDCFGTVRIVGE